MSRMSGTCRPRTVTRRPGDPFTAGITGWSESRGTEPLSLPLRFMLAGLALYIAGLAYAGIAALQPVPPGLSLPYQAYLSPDSFTVQGPALHGPPSLVSKWYSYCVPNLRPYRSIELYCNPDGTFWLYFHFPIWQLQTTH